MEKPAVKPQSKDKAGMADPARPEIDTRSIDHLWGSHKETTQRVSTLETQVGVIAKDVHHVRTEIQAVSETQDRLTANVAAGFDKISTELSRGRSPNWQMLQVLGPTLFSILTFMGFVFYREIDHTRGEINHAEELSEIRDDHNDHIQNLKNQSQVQITDLKIENATLKSEAKP